MITMFLSYIRKRARKEAHRELREAMFQQVVEYRQLQMKHLHDAEKFFELQSAINAIFRLNNDLKHKLKQ